ncbi:MAG: hypothetical protein QGD94_05685, partial [Planctomycetia bacterium]|nr:hypothetical protein [Planctomycetia bacterium]
NGLAGWWWPAGLRADENSNFGVINADRTLTPAAQVAKKYAPDIAAITPHSEPDVWLTIDRDEHTSALAGLWARHNAEYLEAREGGKSVGLRTAGTGTTSANVPLVAVGNVPCNGRNPPKFLNAEFNWLKIQDAQGKWVEVEDGDSVEVKAGQPVQISASVGNTGEATWLAARGGKVEEGAVCLVAESAPGEHRRFAVTSDVPRYSDAEIAEFTLDENTTRETQVAFRMEAFGRASFGERRRITLSPV